MKNKKIIYISIFTLLACSSCTKIEQKNYNNFKLTYTDYARVEGHLYKYQKVEVSKELGEKTFNIFKNILESNDKSANQYGAEGFVEVGYYTFDFVYEENQDIFYISKDDDNVLTYYKSNNGVIFRYYKSLSESYLKEVKELKSTFEKTLKDVEWIYD